MNARCAVSRRLLSSSVFFRRTTQHAHSQLTVLAPVRRASLWVGAPQTEVDPFFEDSIPSPLSKGTKNVAQQQRPSLEDELLQEGSDLAASELSMLQELASGKR